MTHATTGAADGAPPAFLVHVARPARPGSATRLTELLVEHGLGDVVDLALTARAVELLFGICPRGTCARYTVGRPAAATSAGPAAEDVVEVELRIRLEDAGDEGRAVFRVVRRTDINYQVATVAKIVVSDVKEPSGQLPRAVVRPDESAISRLGADEQLRLGAELDRIMREYDAGRDAVSPGWVQSVIAQLIEAAGGVLMASRFNMWLVPGGHATVAAVRRLATELRPAGDEPFVAVEPVRPDQRDLLAVAIRAAQTASHRALGVPMPAVNAGADVGRKLAGLRALEHRLWSSTNAASASERRSVSNGAGQEAPDVVGYVVLQNVAEVYSSPVKLTDELIGAGLAEYITLPSCVGHTVDAFLGDAITVDDRGEVMIVARADHVRVAAAQSVVHGASRRGTGAHLVIIGVAAGTEFAHVIAAGVRSRVSYSISRFENEVRTELRRRTPPCAATLAAWREDAHKLATQVNRYRDALPADMQRELVDHLDEVLELVASKIHRRS